MAPIYQYPHNYTYPVVSAAHSAIKVAQLKGVSVLAAGFAAWAALESLDQSAKALDSEQAHV